MIHMSQILSKVRELLSIPEHWCKGHLYDGPACCLYGALYRSRKDLSLEEVVHDSDEAFAKALGFPTFVEAVDFNDSPGTTHADILKVLDIALSKLQPDRKLEIAKAAHKSMAAQAK